MDDDSWSARFSYASGQYQSALQTRSDMFLEFEELDVDDEMGEHFPCPFCSEYFDIVGLCSHIDEEHPDEPVNGVCPVCGRRAGSDMVAHIMLQHGNFFKMQLSKRTRKGGSHSTFSLLRKELRDGTLQSLFGGSHRIVSSSNSAPDPLLSSFILPMTDDFTSSQPINDQPHSSANVIPAKKISEESASERNVKQIPLSIKDQEEKAKRCNFVQGLLLSTILDDNS